AAPAFFQSETCLFTLVDRAQHFAADPLRLRFAIAEDPLAGRNDADSHSLQDDRQLPRLPVDPAAGFADPLDLLNDPFAVGAVLQVQPQDLDRLFVHDLEIPDVSFALQHLGDSLFLV